MSNFTDFISSGGGASFPTIFLHNSQTWVPPQDGNIMIHVIGAGGSGCMSTTSTTYQSGAAGGYCRKNSLAVTTSGSFTVVVGAGGAPVFGAGGGNAGGNTTVAGTGLSSTLTANGGALGAISAVATTAGGTASGGDVNNTGGTGGYQKGGGAVGLTGTGNSGFYRNFLADGGSCDIIGDFYSSTLGQLSGGIGSSGSYVSNINNWSIYDKYAAPLAGGGYMYGTYFSVGGDASIGGGGGATYNSYVDSYQRSGRGGEGCVVIQYIP